MKKFVMFFIFFIVLSVVLLTSSSVYAQMKMGAVINCTGPASSWGMYHAKGHQDYIKYLNEVKGGIAGKKVELTVYDHAYKLADGLKYAKKLCEDKNSIIATWDTGFGIQAKPLVKQYRIPCINYSTGQEILKPPIDYMYLPFGSYILDTHAMLEYIKAIHKGKEPPKVGLIAVNNAYGKSVSTVALADAKKYGVNIVAFEEFPTAIVDLSTQMLKLKEAGAEYVLMQLLPPNIITALKAADQVGFNGPFFGTWTSTDADFFKLGKGLIKERLFMEFPGALPQDNTPGIKVYNELVERYKSTAGIGYDTSYWEGVIIAMLMERALEKSMKMFGNVEPESVNKAMESFRNEDFGGLFPNVTYTKDNHEASFVGRIVQVHEGASYTPMTNFFVPGKNEMKVLRRPK